MWNGNTGSEQAFRGVRMVHAHLDVFRIANEARHRLKLGSETHANLLAQVWKVLLCSCKGMSRGVLLQSQRGNTYPSIHIAALESVF